jgi:hypothetical protein
MKSSNPQYARVNPQSKPVTNLIEGSRKCADNVTAEIIKNPIRIDFLF